MPSVRSVLVNRHDPVSGSHRAGPPESTSTQGAPGAGSASHVPIVAVADATRQPRPSWHGFAGSQGAPAPPFGAGTIGAHRLVAGSHSWFLGQTKALSTGVHGWVGS